MAILTTIDKQVLEGLFQMGGGYVLDFSDRTMSEFFKDDIGINIYDEKYNYASGSKANRIRGLWNEADNNIISTSILRLIEYIEKKIAIGDFKELDFPKKRIEEGKKIGNSLKITKDKTIKVVSESDFSEDIEKHLMKAEEEIKKADYDGSIGTLSTFLEEFFESLHIKLTGTPIGESADLKKDFVKIKNLLNLAPDGHTDQKLKQMLVGFSQIVDALDSLCNSLGDRHRKLKDEDGLIKVKPLKHHALLMLNASKTLTQFLYNTYEYQTLRKEELESELINILKSDITKQTLSVSLQQKNRLSSQNFEDIHKNKFIKKWLSKSDNFINHYLIKRYLTEYNITSGEKSCEFFGLMTVLYNDLIIDDVESIYNKRGISKNDQVTGLLFINDLIKNRCEIVSSLIQKEIEIQNLKKHITEFPLPNNLKGINKIKEIIKQNPGEQEAKIGTKSFYVSEKGIEELISFFF